MLYSETLAREKTFTDQQEENIKFSWSAKTNRTDGCSMRKENYRG